MGILIPTLIERQGQSQLRVSWSDGLDATISMEALRRSCPCAYCKGEQVFGMPVTLPLIQFVPGMYDVLRLEPVGNYGIRAVWADGHSSGIYTWQLLRQLTENAKDNPHTSGQGNNEYNSAERAITARH